MVNREILKEIVVQQKVRDFKVPNLVIREIVPEILASFRDKRILILAGLRRSGKSTLLWEIMTIMFCFKSSMAWENGLKRKKIQKTMNF